MKNTKCDMENLGLVFRTVKLKELADRQECLSYKLDVEVTDVERVLLDEVASRFYGVTH